MKKITIIFMSVLMIFASCSMDIPYDDIIENAETVEESKEDNSKNNTEEPSNEENDTENDGVVTEPTENDNNEEGNSENTETVEESKEDNSKNNTEEPSNKENDTENDGVEEGNSENTEIVEESKEDDSENKDVEISEDTKILGLNYFVCVDNSQTKLSPSINDESQAKKDTFLIRGYASKYIEIRVGYKNKKLNFSSVSDNYIKSILYKSIQNHTNFINILYEILLEK